MVSFQCLGCGDVVKKPKLDQHRSNCHTGFDCIDCSKTFNTPAEYKGHTSCISEAEKYQKSLYKGPKTGSNGQKSMNSTEQPNSVSDTTNLSASRQSNAQWNRNPQPTSVDNVNGYPGVQYQDRQNGWRNNGDNHRYNDRRGKSSGRQQNGFSRSSARGANETPLGEMRRSLLGKQACLDDVGPSEAGNCVDEVSQAKKVTDMPPKEKRKLKVAESTDNSFSHLGKKKSDVPKGEKSFLVDDEDNKEMKTKKRKEDDVARAESRTTEADTADSNIKEKAKKKMKRKEKEANGEQASADVAVGADDRKNAKKDKKHIKADDEQSSARVGDTGSKEKKKTKKEKKRQKNADDTEIVEDVVVPTSFEEQTTTAKMKKKKINIEGATADLGTLIVENTAAEDIVMSGEQTAKTTKRKKKARDSGTPVVVLDTTTETAMHVDKEERQRRREKKREKEVVPGDTEKLKKTKRKRDEEPIAKEKKRKYNSESVES